MIRISKLKRLTFKLLRWLSVYSIPDLKIRIADQDCRRKHVNQLSNGIDYNNVLQKYREYFVLMSPKEKMLGRLCLQRRVWNNEHLAILYSLYVSPSVRGAGFAKKLILFAVDFAKKEGYGHLILFVKRDNISAIRIYESLQFRQVELKDLSEVYQETFSNINPQEEFFYRLELQ